MPITAKAGGTFTRILPPEDNHPARCIGLVHTGTITDEKYGTKKNLVRITWELPLEKAVFKEGEEEKPFVITKEYNLSLAEKATLRSHLENWRGQKFTEKELAGFNIDKLLKTTCMVQVVHGESAKGDKYAYVSSVSKLPKGYTVPDMINEVQYFSVDEFNQKVFDTFPEWLQDKIKESEEYKKLFDQTPIGEEPSDEVETNGDDLPF